MLRRWLWLVLLCGVVGAAGSYLYSRHLPDLYTSDMTVLVAPPKVPEKYAQSLVSSEQFDQRLGIVNQEVRSRSHVEQIIRRSGIYKQEIDRVPMDALVRRANKSIVIKPVQSALENASAPAGFYITYTAEDPLLAQRVCSEIAALLTEGDVRLKEQRAESTKSYLQEEIASARRKLDEAESQLTAFKRQYLGKLPDQAQANLDILLQLNIQLQGATQEVNRASQDKTRAESLLSSELQAWELSKAGSNPLTLEQQLAQAQAQLVTLEGRYTSSYPDIIKLKNDIQELKKKIAAGQGAAKGQVAEGDPQKMDISEPPHIRNMRNEIYSLQRSIEAKTQEKQKLEAHIQEYQSRVQTSPLVEGRYKELSLNYQNALGLYDDLVKKQTNAGMASNLERRQESEQFQILDAPNLPLAPGAPDRQLFALEGLGGGVAFGLIIALLLEMSDKSIRNESEVEVFLQLRTLAVIPKLRPARLWVRGRKELVRTLPGGEA
jgi:polysaccharide chain length determinant protein (PEP-CTERM system associated)